VTSVIGLAFLPRGWVLAVITLQLLPLPLLKAKCPERFPDKVRAGPGVPPSSLFFSKGCASDVTSFVSERAEASTMSSHTSRSPGEDPTVRLSISSSTVFLKFLPDVLSFLRRNFRLGPRSFILLLHSGPFRRLFSTVDSL
jgi:hypothetical protein